MAEATAAAEEAVETAAKETPPPPEPGWYRNTAATPLIVQPHRYPSKTLAPGAATWLPDNPRHPDLVPCDEPPPTAGPTDGADTTGSEK